MSGPPPTVYIQSDGHHVADLLRRDQLTGGVPDGYEMAVVTAYDVFVDRLGAAVAGAHRSAGSAVAVETIDGDALARRLLSIGQSAHAVSLHPLVDLPGRNLAISRLYRAGGVVPLGDVARPGSPPLEEQLGALAVVAGDRPVTLIDDDCSSGTTLRRAVDHLAGAGIEVERAVVGVDALSAEQRDEVAGRVGTFASLRHLDRHPDGRLVDARNFVLGVDGLVVRGPGAEIGRVPYFHPFTSAAHRVGIPPGSEQRFALDVLAANIALYATLDDQGVTPTVDRAQPGTRHVVREWLDLPPDQPLLDVARRLSTTLRSTTSACGDHAP
jgi:hypothetical protein